MNFKPVHLKIKNIIMQLLFKGCPLEGCNLMNTPITYEAVIKHLSHECNKIKVKC